MAKAKGNRRLIAVCITVYFVCLIALMPLNVVYRVLAPTNLPVDVLAVSGTIWQGKVVIKHDMTGQLDAKWALKPLSLITGRLQAQMSVDSSVFDFKSLVTVNGLTQSIELEKTSGLVSAGLINKIIAQSKTKMSGDLELNNTHVEYNFATGESSAASGQLVWMGGQVKYPKGRKMASANLPMLVAKLGSENKELKVDVATTDGVQVANASLKKDGWANVAVRKAMIDLVGEKWPNKVSADAVVFEVSERIFTR
ncbi:MAG: type II secretion system protein N [Bermanella sp.]